MNQYQGVALIGLFDCIATLAEALGDQLNNQQEAANILFPILIQKLQQF